MSSQHDVFISYATPDRVLAYEICSSLENAGISCWIAPRDMPGTKWDSYIPQAIRRCKSVVLVLSASANTSSYVQKEVALATKYGKEVIPLRIDEASPQDGLELHLVDRHWLDVTSKEFSDCATHVSNRIFHAMSVAPTVKSIGRPHEVPLAKDVKFEMMWIPPGTFTMGSPECERGRRKNEGPQHPVEISDGFWMSKNCVTKEQWYSVMHHYVSLIGNKRKEFPADEKCFPAVMVSWFDCQSFLAKLNERTDGGFRLPSEAEWEYACRAGSQCRYAFGDDDSQLYRYAEYNLSQHTEGERILKALMNVVYDICTILGPCKTGELLPNAWGLHDMHGNICEWCEDTYSADYVGAPTDGSAWVKRVSGNRVIRGGCSASKADGCRNAWRQGLDASDRVNLVGFRLVRDN